MGASVLGAVAHKGMVGVLAPRSAVRQAAWEATEGRQRTCSRQRSASRSAAQQLCASAEELLLKAAA